MDVPMHCKDTHYALMDSLTRIRVADIDHHDSRLTASKFLEAEIVLVWPYSTLTREAGFLLAEKDVLLRKTKGQVKTTFYGACAQEIARLKAGVGDTLRISLRTAHYVEEQDEISTPGKKAGFAIRYQKAINAEIVREDGQVTSLSYEEPVVVSPVQNEENGIPATPRDTRLHGTIESEPPVPTSTPTFKTGSRLSSNSFPGSFIDPFVSEDGSVAGRGRKRTKFGRHSGAWRLIDDDEVEQEQSRGLPLLLPSPSPSVHGEMETTAITVHTEVAPSLPIPIESTSELLNEEKVEYPVFDVGSPQRSADDTDKAEGAGLSINITPLSSSAERSIRNERPSFDSESMPTLQLRALTSPGPSIVSPPVPDSQYSPTSDTAVSELDASLQTHDQAVFADSSPNLPDSLETNQLEFYELDPIGQIPGDHDLTDANVQAAFLPVSLLRSGEVDLDALQEQIDMNNATPVPVEETEEIIEDSDIYGSPIATFPLQPLEITYPSLHNLGEQSLDPAHLLSDEDVILLERPTTDTAVIEVEPTGNITVSESGPTPLPSLLDNAAKELEFFARDYQTESVVIDISSTEVAELETSYFPRRDHLSAPMPRSLDGSVDMDPVTLEEVPTQPIDLPQSEEAVNDIFNDDLGGTAIVKEIPYSAVDVQAISSSPLIESSRATTQTETSMQVDESAIIVTSPPEAVNILQSQEAPAAENEQLSGTSIRRKSQRLLNRPSNLTGIYSEYFTPRKGPRARGSSPMQQDTLLLNEERADASMTAPAGLRHEDIADTAYSKSFLSSVTTELGSYVHLTQLPEYYNQVVDVIALCVSDSTNPERAKSGPKDFHTSLHLINVSQKSGENSHTTAQIFRPRKNVLPHTRRGDVVVLRSFLVQSASHTPMLLSTDASAWAVFPCEDELRHDTELPTIISGPPIEIGSGEESIASTLLTWWRDEGNATIPESSMSITMNPDTPSRSKSGGPTRKSKSDLPPPLDLRRSPRKVRSEQFQNNTELKDGRDRSPSFQPLSPTFSQRFLQNSMAPPSIPAASASTGSLSKTGFRSDHVHPNLEAESQNADIGTAPISGTDSTYTRHTRSVSRTSLEVSQHSPVGPSQDHGQNADYDAADPVDRPIFTPRQNLSGSISETNSVSGETNSSRRHRHERRSTSLIHELRDGTQWVDVEDSEIVSVSASESSDEDIRIDEPVDTSPPMQATEALESIVEQPDAEVVIEVDMDNDEAIAEPEIEQVEPPTTPGRRGRGRPRKDDSQQSPPLTHTSRRARVLSNTSTSTVDESAVNLSPTSPAIAGSGRVTRSRQKATAEQERNVHELRDGAKYTDQ